MADLDPISRWNRLVLLGAAFVAAGAAAVDVTLFRKDSQIHQKARDKAQDLAAVFTGRAADAKACVPSVEGNDLVYRLAGVEHRVKPNALGRGDMAFRGNDKGMVLLHTGECFVFPYDDRIRRLDFTADEYYLRVGGEQYPRLNYQKESSSAKRTNQDHTPG